MAHNQAVFEVMLTEIEMLIRKHFGMTLIIQSTNVLNHLVLGVPNLALGNPTTFGTITASAACYRPRQMEFGLRFNL